MARASNRIASLFSSYSHRQFIVLLIGFLLLLLAHGMALVFRIQPAVSLWFPPSGVAIALTLWQGPIGAVMTAAAAFTVAPLWGGTGWSRLASVTDAIEPLVAWFLFCRCFNGTLALTNLWNATAFLVSAPLVACCISAISGTLTLMTFGKISPAALPGIIPHWWLGNAIGTMVIAPVALLLISWSKDSGWGWSAGTAKVESTIALENLRQRWLEICLILTATIFFAFLTVEATQFSIFATLQFSLLSIISVFWAVARFGVVGSVMTASFSVFVTLLAYLVVYPNAITLPAFPVEPELLFTHKLSLLMQCAIALLAGAAITERATAQVALEVEKIKRTDSETRAQLSEELLKVNYLLNETNQRLQTSEERFRTSIENMLDCFGVYSAIRNLEGQIVDFRVDYVNDAACTNNQLTREQQVGHGLCELLPGHRDSGLFDEYCQVVETGRSLIRDSLIYEDDYGQRRLVRAFDIRIAKLGDGFVATWRDVTDRRQTEDELRFRKQELKTLVENSPDIISRIDQNLRHVYVSPAIEVATGIPAANFVGKTYAEVGFPAEICHNWNTRLQRIFATGHRLTDELPLPSPDGALRHYETRIIPEFTPDGLVPSVICITRDVTELKQVERSLRQANEQFRLASEAVNSAIYDWDLAQNRIERSSGIDRVFGYSPNEIQPTMEWYLALVHPEDLAEVMQQLEATFGRGDRYHMEYRVRHRSGAYLHVADQGLVIRNPSGQVVRVVGSVADISERARLEAERKQIETALKQSEERLRLTLEAMPQMVWISDVTGAVSYWNQQWYDYCWASEAESLGLRGIETVHPDDRDYTLQQWQQAVEMGRTFEVEYRIRRHDGLYRWFISRAIPLRDSDGQITNWIGTITDIDDQKRTQEELRQSEERLALALRSARAGMWQWLNKDHRNIWSDENYRLLGYEPGQVVANYGNWVAAIHPDDRERAQQVANRAMAEQTQLAMEYRVCLPDGSVRWLASTGQLTYGEDAQPNGMIGIQIDITQRKQTEIALQQSQERLNLAMEAARMGSWDWDIQTGQVHWSSNLERLFDMAPGSFDGRFETVLAMVHPDDREWVLQSINRAIDERQDYNIEFRFVRPDGTVRWAVGRGRVFYNAAGVPVQMTGVDLDISERKEVETERVRLLEREQAARQQAESASRMKDEFLAIVSHELRSPLNGILGWSRLLRSRQLDPVTTEKALASIERNAQAQTQLIEDLLDISRIIRGAVRLSLNPVNLGTIVQAAVDTVRPTAETKSIQISARFVTQSCWVSGDAERLQQVVWNLLSNAIKFTPEQGQVSVHVDQVRSHVRIQVVDTGKGINAEFLPHVFDRFRQADSTTTRTQGGLGLGLAIVRNLVELHGGSVWVESEGEGRGASFFVELPLLAEISQPSNSSLTADAGGCPTSLSDLRVLVVDDEADTREFLAAALEQFGAVVTIAGSAPEALELFQQQPPDLLLSDIGMPGEDGYSLIQKIRALPTERGGKTPAAALTAYVRGDDRLEALKAGFQMHVPKPIDPVQLLTVIAQLVGRVSAPPDP